MLGFPKLARAGNVLLALASLCGCGTQYSGEDCITVHPPASFQTLNGIGAHQRMWESAGAKLVFPTRLSPLLETMDTVVLVGRTYAPPGVEARDWLERWLSQKQGRSVIYFGRDFDAELYYRELTLTKVAKPEQERARQLWAMQAALQFSIRVSETSPNIFCRWFYRDGGRKTERVSQFTGPWARDLIDESGFWPVSIPLLPPNEELRQSTQAAMVAEFQKKSSSSNTTIGSGPNGLVFRSNWYRNEIDSAQELDAEWERAPRSEVLLASNRQTPLVTQLTSTSFLGSRILLVVNGGPLLNGSLTAALQRKIATKIIQQCQPAKRVAVLVYDQSGIRISNMKEKDPRVAGLEMLTVWPLNILSMHAALLGILVCMVLLPVLGRPQHLPQRSLADFGHHVEALGKMLHQTGDRAYACKAIVDYFRSVRGEPGPAWAQQTIDTPRK